MPQSYLQRTLSRKYSIPAVIIVLLMTFVLFMWYMGSQYDQAPVNKIHVVDQCINGVVREVFTDNLTQRVISVSTKFIPGKGGQPEISLCKS
jgi:hypothetical protein